jgi:hypothetical protein
VTGKVNLWFDRHPFYGALAGAFVIALLVGATGLAGDRKPITGFLNIFVTCAPVLLGVAALRRWRD